MGMDDLGEEVQALSQQCNGGSSNNNSVARDASSHTTDTGSVWREASGSGH